METEIELKYLVDDENIVEKLNQRFNQSATKYSYSEKNLVNTYFDTKELTLRKLEMGLRIRTYPDSKEQTIKTSGKVVAGLHQRPEYNVTVDVCSPQLSLFPDSIWPNDLDTGQLEQELLPIFSTNFVRNQWLLSVDEHTEVEVCFDSGLIESNGKQQKIAEIELELKKGEVTALFTVAKQLFSILTMRPGKRSKAARGYGLWQNIAQEDKVSERRLLNPINQQQSVAQVFYSGVEFGLGQIQDHIHCYIENPELNDLFAIRDAMQMLSYGMKQFEAIIGSELIVQLKQQLEELIEELYWLDKSQHINELTVKSGNYRKKLEYSKQLIALLKLKRDSFPTEQDMIVKLQSEKFNRLQANLLQLLLEGRSSIDLPKLSEFAYQALEANLQQLIAISAQQSMSLTQYLELKPLLEMSLLSGSWFGALYNMNERQEYRGPWLDILHGIDELAIFALLQRQLQQLEEQPQKVIAWLDSKIENLLMAIEHSREIAIEITPYWRIT